MLPISAPGKAETFSSLLFALPILAGALCLIGTVVFVWSKCTWTFGRGMIPLGAGFILLNAFDVSSFRGDAIHVAAFTQIAEGHPRQLLTRFLYHLGYRVSCFIVGEPEGFGFLARGANVVAFVNLTATVLAVILMVRVYEQLAKELPTLNNRVARMLSFGLLLSAFGIVKMGVWHVEVYPVAMLAQAALMLACAKIWCRDGKLSWLWIAWVIVVATHLVHVMALPVVLWLTWQNLRSQKQGQVLEAKFKIALGLVAGMIAVGAVFGWLAIGESLGTGLVFAGDELVLEVIWNRLRVWWLLAWAMPFMVGAAVLHMLNESNERSSLTKPFGALCLWWLLPYLAWSILWRPQLGVAMDWDLYQPVTLPFILCCWWVVSFLFQTERTSPAKTVAAVSVFLQALTTIGLILGHAAALSESPYHFGLMSRRQEDVAIAISFPETKSMSLSEPFSLAANAHVTDPLQNLQVYVLLDQDNGPALFNRDIFIPLPGPRFEVASLSPGNYNLPLISWEPDAAPRPDDYLTHWLRPGRYTAFIVLGQRGSRSVQEPWKWDFEVVE